MFLGGRSELVGLPGPLLVPVSVPLGEREGQSLESLEPC